MVEVEETEAAVEAVSIETVTKGAFQIEMVTAAVSAKIKRMAATMSRQNQEKYTFHRNVPPTKICLLAPSLPVSILLN